MTTSVSLLTLNLDGGSLGFACSPQVARELKAALEDTLAARLRGVAENPKQRQESFEFRQTGELFLEVFCNPNQWATPFVAKVYITVKTAQVRVSAEVLLSQVREDLDRFLEACA
ncbi:hypothetical protein [Synechococcus sp. PCC 7336]|uniref:hypothetical protein n=1 Tax=Synechococcus sp. PCC 7336 TaxID=195250 RepID=UPI00034CA507|nr:hypothetical protein [Synechococcus sp. PCC 7336]